jgi:hypothetical protein
MNLVSVTVAAALLLAWLGWFALAQISLYERSQPVSVTSQETIAAIFPPSALGKIRRGQAARVAFDNPAAAGTPVVQAVVVDARPGDQGIIRAEILIIQRGWAPPRPGRELTGRVEVETERVSPASLVVRAAGRAGASNPSQP